ncbi:MAG: NAD(P)/FAD-dependent oxidoreductase [Candidatus Syntrophoarchaeum sp.]|nr:NAD(P)/FAD-dependent oxidoreductase [Candidatus Syntrophoarchaeum sp.]
MNYDVIVVGAGPAGSVAAKLCADKGLKTLLLEMGREPGEKNCSGTTIPLFNLYEDFPWINDPEMPITRNVYSNTHYWVFPDGERWFKTEAVGGVVTPPRAVNVYRDLWDPWLASKAMDAGAELRKSTTVWDVIKEGDAVCGVVTHTGEKIRSGVVIAADGLNSMVSIKAGLRDKRRVDEYGVCVKYDFESTPEHIEVAFNMADGQVANESWYGGTWSSGRTGYCWLFPNYDSISVGLFTLLSDLKENPFVLMQRFLEHPLVKTKLKGAKPRYYSVRNLNSCKNGVDKTCADGIMAVGDAAGFTCVVEGCGIPAALWSGKFAAETAIDAIASGDVSYSGLKAYETKWKNSFIARDMAGSKKTSDWLYKTVGAEGIGLFIQHAIEGWMLKHGWSEGGHDDACRSLMEDFIQSQLPRYLKLYGSLYEEGV